MSKAIGFVVGVLFFQVSYGNGVSENKNLVLSVDNAPLVSILNELSAQSGYKLEIVNFNQSEKLFSLNVTNQNIGQALKVLLKDLSYYILRNEPDKSMLISVSGSNGLMDEDREYVAGNVVKGNNIPETEDIAFDDIEYYESFVGQ